ncbi:MAG: ATP-binding protein [Polyangiaceae bacterium]
MDPVALLQLENAILRIVTRYDSILREETFEAILGVLAQHVRFKIAGITTSDGKGAYRALILSRSEGGPVVPYRARLSSSPTVYETVYEKREPLYVRRIEEGDPVAKFARAVGLGSYSVYPIPGSRGAIVGGFYFGFDAPDANASLPEELVGALIRAIAGSVERSIEAGRDHRARRILEASEDAMLAWDAEGRITDINAAAERMVQSPRAEIVGRGIAELLGVIPADVAHGQRFEIRTRTGTTLPVTATVSLVDGDPLVAAHALLRDRSDVVAAEAQAAAHLAALRALSEQLTLLLDNAPLVIFRLDPETSELLYLNRHAERLFGVRAEDALETPGFLSALHVDPDGRHAFERAVEAAKRGEPSEPYEARLAHRPAEGDASDPIIARGLIYAIAPRGGARRGIEGVLLDVTTERAARSRLIQADRLATVGMLAAGVAHEINNPAAFMMIGLDTLVRLLKGPSVTIRSDLEETVVQLIEDLRSTSRRIVDIARDMRLFARPPSTELGRLVAVDVARAADSALTITRAQIVEHADVELDIPEDLPPVWMEEGRLGQVLVSILVNAAQSIGDAREARGAPATFEGRGSRRETVRIRVRAADGRVVITVDDTGIGMTPAVVARLFTPFFTTKGPERGTGLGLAIAKAIVERAHGTISVTSPGGLGDPPRGARVTLDLPAADQPVVSEAEAPRAGGPRGRVLIVEDEPLLRKALAEQLAQGHDVAVAESGRAALEMLSASHFDAVLCDLKMPGMSGETLYRRVASEHPYLRERFVFMTGVGFGAETESFIASVGAPMLEKPFAMEEALECIASVLRAERPAPK